jgi:hypothetical protein
VSFSISTNYLSRCGGEWNRTGTGDDSLSREEGAKAGGYGFCVAYFRASELSRFYTRFQPRVLALDGDDELDFACALLLLEITGFLADELLKGIQR